MTLHPHTMRIYLTRAWMSATGLAIIAAMLFSACTPAGTASPTATLIPSSTHTPSPTASPTSTDTPQPSPTPTLTATATATEIVNPLAGKTMPEGWSAQIDYTDHPEIADQGIVDGCELVSMVENPAITQFITILNPDGSPYPEDIPIAVYAVPGGDLSKIDYEHPLAVGKLVYGPSQQFTHSMNFTLNLGDGQGLDYVVVVMTADGKVIPVPAGQIDGVCSIGVHKREPPTPTRIFIRPTSTATKKPNPKNTPKPTQVPPTQEPTSPPPPTQEPTDTPRPTPPPMITPTSGT